MATIPSVAHRGEGTILAHSKFQISIILLLLAIAGPTLRASAGLPIEIFDTRNSTFLDISKFAGINGTNHTQRQASTLPLTDTIYSWNGAIAGVASASLFEVSTVTKRLGTVTPVVGTLAFSTNEISFQSLATTTATLEFERSITGGFHVNDNQIRIHLLDVDSGQVLLNYYWDRSLEHPSIGSAEVSFNSGANYKLTISARSIEDNHGPSPGGWPQTVASLRVTGFDPISVPEPTTAGILGLGLLTWWSRRRN